MKRNHLITTICLTSALLLMPVLTGCNQSGKDTALTGSTTATTTAPTLNEPASTTTVPSTDKPAPDEPASTTTAPTTTEPTPITTTEPDTAPKTEPETDPTPVVLPGNPAQYGFTMLPYTEPETWFYFENKQLWSYLYTTQTGIGDTLDLSLLKPSQYDEATDSYVPSADAYEQGWRQQMDTRSSELTPITGMSAVLAFIAPEDGCYLFEFHFNASVQAGTNSDGIRFFLFGDDRLVYSSEQLNYEEIYTGIEAEFVSLRKGEKAYFVADPLQSGTGDSCDSVGFEAVVRQADIDIDNESTFAFGNVYHNDSLEQGTNGWYAGYADADAQLSPEMVGSDPIPAPFAYSGNVFGYVADDPADDPDKIGVVLWKAPADGEYTVSVDGWWHDSGVLISFYNGGELITALDDTFFSGTYQMTCTLKKGECFAITFAHSETPNTDAIDELAILIRQAS